jgi:hypothetical protein
MAPTLDDIRIGKRNVLIVLIVLALFDIAAVVLLFTVPGLPGVVAQDAAEPRTQAQSEQEPSAQGEAETAESEAPSDSSRDGTSVSEEDTEAPERDGAKAQDEAATRAESSTDQADGDARSGEGWQEASPIPPAARTATGTHTVKRGETFYELSGELWEDEHLWPDLYVLNQQQFTNPDLVPEGSEISVYERLGSDGSFNPREMATLLQAYVDTYRRYRALGEQALERGRETGSRWLIELARARINKAHWLLYSGMRFRRDLLDHFDDQIEDRDERVVRQFVERFGYVDP